ncbi:MAG: hypothetical protein EBT07_12295 [Actinobacteria bacterium]|nr:hypothetical protein [Actinomycetota bacterium]
MPFTIPEIYVGQVVSGEVVLTDGQVETNGQVDDTPPMSPYGVLNDEMEIPIVSEISEEQTPTYNPQITVPPEKQYRVETCQNGEQVYVDEYNSMFNINSTPSSRSYIGRYSPNSRGQKCLFEYRRA